MHVIHQSTAEKLHTIVILIMYDLVPSKRVTSYFYVTNSTNSNSLTFNIYCDIEQNITIMIFIIAQFQLSHGTNSLDGVWVDILM